jgi:hypothetical protein
VRTDLEVEMTTYKSRWIDPWFWCDAGLVSLLLCYRGEKER